MDTTSSVRVVHRLPWRVRLAVPPLTGQRGACERMATQLAAERGCHTVSIRPETGSVIVEGPEGELDAALVERRVRAFVDAEMDDAGLPLAMRRAQPVDATKLAGALAQAATSLNARIGQQLAGKADLGTLLPIALTAAGAAQVSLSGQLPPPPWSSLLWYSLRSFLSFNREAIRAAQDGGGRTPSKNPTGGAQ